MMQDPNPNRVTPYLWRDTEYRPELPPGLPGDAPLHSERALWLYIFKGVGMLLGGAFLLINIMYGLFELLGRLAG